MVASSLLPIYWFSNFPEIFQFCRKHLFNPYRPDPGQRAKINLNYFYFHTSLWCLKRFYESLKAFPFIKPFEAPQRSAKIKIWVNFHFNATFWNARGGKVNTKPVEANYISSFIGASASKHIHQFFVTRVRSNKNWKMLKLLL